MENTEQRNQDLETFWQSVFGRSRVNGANYRGEYLPMHRWSWPTGTVFQRRLRELRTHHLDHLAKNNSEGERKEIGATGAELTPSEDLIAVDLAQPGNKLSCTNAVLKSDSDGWARVTDGEVRPVKIDEKSVQAALHKENLEKFQSALVQSGEWIRADRSESDQTPVAKQNEIDQNLDVKPAKVKAVEPVPVPAPTPIVSVAQTRAVIDDPALPAVKENSPNRPAHAPVNDYQWWQPTPEISSQAKPKEIDWQDIDEKLLWLAKPSS